MAIIKTIAEVKELLPMFVSNLSSVTSLPNFEAAEYKYLVPITGTALYNDIHGKYNANTVLSADETSLLKKMRLLVAANAYHDGLILGHITLTDNGARKFNPNQTVPVAKWEYEKLEKTLRELAADATDVLIRYLFEKLFALWTDSDEYKEINSLLIKTGTEFSKHYKLFQPMLTFYNIKTNVADAQELYLKKGLGEDLFNHILGVTNPDNQLAPIILKLKKSLAFFTIKECCSDNNVRFSSEGFTVLSGEGNFDSADHSGRKAADHSDLDMKMAAADTKGQTFLSMAISELVNYYRRTDVPVSSEDFRTSLLKGPLNARLATEEITSGNERRKGVFRL